MNKVSLTHKCTLICEKKHLLIIIVPGSIMKMKNKYTPPVQDELGRTLKYIKRTCKQLWAVSCFLISQSLWGCNIKYYLKHWTQLTEEHLFDFNTVYYKQFGGQNSSFLLLYLRRVFCLQLLWPHDSIEPSSLMGIKRLSVWDLLSPRHPTSLLLLDSLWIMWAKGLILKPGAGFIYV